MQIDRFGRFAYVLVRLSDRLAGSKLLVRGHNGRTEEQLVSAVTKEVGSGRHPPQRKQQSPRVLLLPHTGPAVAQMHTSALAPSLAPSCRWHNPSSVLRANHAGYLKARDAWGCRGTYSVAHRLYRVLGV